MASKVVSFLGSIRLAVPLLAAIAVILIGATFYEAYAGTATVQREVYKSVWFGGLMFLLAVNLALSTLSRYPWRGGRKIGFALTHWGLVVIIAGSAAVIHLSTEGMVLVRTDGGPTNQVRIEGEQLELVGPDRRRHQADLFVRPDQSVYPPQVGGLSLVGYSASAIKTVSFSDGGGVDNLAVKLALHSDRMGQTLERWLALAPAGYRQLDVGPAHLEITQAQDEADLQQLLSPPAPQTAPFGTLQLGTQTVDVQSQLGHTLTLATDITAHDITVELAGFWPDFRLDGNHQPTSASSQLQNPALQLNLTQGDQQARWYVFANPEFSPIRSGAAIAATVTYTAPPPTPTDYFRVVAAPDHQLFYAALSSAGFKTGELHPGQPITPGWADFQISLLSRLDKAQVQRQMVPVTPVADAPLGDAGAPALQVATAEGQTYWLPWGEPTALETAGGTYFAAFSPKLLELPFYLKLNDFIVERNEGSESVAMWTSDVTLFDPQRDTAVQRTVWMNHPTWFRGWKLAQASWNPGDLQQSTLQLKREPWWVTALTWSGSLMVVLGIGTMFYGPGLVKRWRRVSATVTPELEETEAAPAPTIPIFAVFTK